MKSKDSEARRIREDLLELLLTDERHDGHRDERGFGGGVPFATDGEFVGFGGRGMRERCVCKNPFSIFQSCSCSLFESFFLPCAVQIPSNVLRRASTPWAWRAATMLWALTKGTSLSFTL